MQLNISNKELRNLMEMTSLALVVAGTASEETDIRYGEWEKLHSRIFNLARQEPDLAKLLAPADGSDEMSFTQEYMETSYLTSKLDEYSEHVFWSDLVSRLADKALEGLIGTDEFELLSEEEKRTMTEPLEKSLWNECSTYGIDRLGFIIPPHEA